MSDDIIEPSDVEQAAWPQATEAYVRGMENRIEELEAKLEKAVEFVECAINYAKTCGARFPMDHALTTLAELTNERSDEKGEK